MIRRGTARRLGLRRPEETVVECWHRGHCFCGMGLRHIKIRNMVIKDPVKVLTAEQLAQLSAAFNDNPSAFKIDFAALNRAPLTGWPARYFDAGIEDL